MHVLLCDYELPPTECAMCHKNTEADKIMDIYEMNTSIEMYFLFNKEQNFNIIKRGFKYNNWTKESQPKIKNRK